MGPTLPAGWQSAWSAEYQQWYYFNISTGQRQWQPPAAAQSIHLNHQADAAIRATNSADTCTPCNAAATTEAAQQQQQLAKDSCAAAAAAAASHNTLTGPFWYYDPRGQLLGPFTVEQLTAWRPYLPMDLTLCVNPGSKQHSCSIANHQLSSSSSADKAAVQSEADTVQHAAPSDDGDTAATAPAAQQQQQHTPDASDVSPAAAAADADAECNGSLQQQQQQQQQAASSAATEATTASAASPVATAEADTGECACAAAAIAHVPAAVEIEGRLNIDVHASHQQQQQQQQQCRTLLLADLLGDTRLLDAWRVTQQQQQQQQQQCVAAAPEAGEKQQQQQQQHNPPRAVAPPATVWEAWCARYNSSIAAAAAPGQQQQHGSEHWRHLQDSAHPSRQGTAAVYGVGKRSSTTRSSGFNKYAAAVLQGLPPDDEAVQLARMAAAQGCTLEEVLQSARSACVSHGTADGAGFSSGSAEGLGASVGVLLTKDPRSGRLVAAEGPNSSSNDGSSKTAMELYGDLARWCNPAELEKMLQRAKAKKQRLS